jgi:hypothetical protein
MDELQRARDEVVQAALHIAAVEWTDSHDIGDHCAGLDDAHDHLEAALVRYAAALDSETGVIQATTLRAFADHIDALCSRPDIPLRPSIFSALARERADEIEQASAPSADLVVEDEAFVFAPKPDGER